LDNIPLTEWFMDNYKKYVSHLEIVTDKSSEGSQFVKGFGGIGGILRYKMETDFDDTDNQNEWNDDDFI
jgi:peptide chain release factor subunit 1